MARTRPPANTRPESNSWERGEWPMRQWVIAAYKNKSWEVANKLKHTLQENEEEHVSLPEKFKRPKVRVSVDEFVAVANYLSNKYDEVFKASLGSGPAATILSKWSITDVAVFQLHQKYINQETSPVMRESRLTPQQIETLKLSPHRRGGWLMVHALEQYLDQPFAHRENVKNPLLDHLLFSTDEKKSDHKNYVKEIDAYFTALQKRCQIKQDDLEVFKGRWHKLIGSLKVMKETVAVTDELMEKHSVDLPGIKPEIHSQLRFFLNKYNKGHKNEFVQFLSHCRHAKNTNKHTDIHKLALEDHIDIHPVHLPLLQQLIDSSEFMFIWPTYHHFDMGEYRDAEMLTTKINEQQVDHPHEVKLTVVHEIAYLKERLRIVNKTNKDPYKVWAFIEIDRINFSTMLSSDRALDLKKYWFIQQDIDAYYRILGWSPTNDLEHIETFVTYFQENLSQGAWSYAAEEAAKKLNANYNLHMKMSEYSKRIEYAHSRERVDAKT